MQFVSRLQPLGKVAYCYEIDQNLHLEWYAGGYLP